MKAPRKTEVFVNIESNNSINSGQNEKVKTHTRSEGSELNASLYYPLFPPFLPFFVRIIICEANLVSREETK